MIYCTWNRTVPCFTVLIYVCLMSESILSPCATSGRRTAGWTAHLLVCSGLETSFVDHHSEGQQTEVVFGTGGHLPDPSRRLTGQIELRLVLLRIRVCWGDRGRSFK